MGRGKASRTVTSHQSTAQTAAASTVKSTKKITAKPVKKASKQPKLARQLKDRVVFADQQSAIEAFTFANELTANAFLQRSLQGQWAEQRAIEALEDAFAGQYRVVHYGASHPGPQPYLSKEERDAQKAFQLTTETMGKRPDLIVVHKDTYDTYKSALVSPVLQPNKKQRMIDYLDNVPDSDPALQEILQQAVLAVEVESSMQLCDAFPAGGQFQETANGTEALRERIKAYANKHKQKISKGEIEALVEQYKDLMPKSTSKELRFPGVHIKDDELQHLHRWQQQATPKKHPTIPLMISKMYPDRAYLFPFQEMKAALTAGVIPDKIQPFPEGAKHLHIVPASLGWELETVQAAQAAAYPYHTPSGKLESGRVFCGGQWSVPDDVAKNVAGLFRNIPKK